LKVNLYLKEILKLIEAQNIFDDKYLSILYQLAFYKESELIINLYKTLILEAKNQITISKKIKNINNLLKINIIID
jgi:hypothetical protein